MTVFSDSVGPVLLLAIQRHARFTHPAPGVPDPRGSLRRSRLGVGSVGPAKNSARLSKNRFLRDAEAKT